MPSFVDSSAGLWKLLLFTLISGAIVSTPVDALSKPKSVDQYTCSVVSESLNPNPLALTGSSSSSNRVSWIINPSCTYPYLHNSRSATATLCNGSSCVSAAATPVPNSYTYNFTFYLSPSSAAGVWIPKLSATSSYLTSLVVNSNLSLSVSPKPEETTTTAVSTTTTVKVANTSTTTTTSPASTTTLTSTTAVTMTSSTSTTALPTTSTVAGRTCSPTTDKLFVYPSLGNVTNFGGVYDSGSSGFDYTRNCKVAPITKVFLKDNFSIVESSSVRFDKYFDKAVSNCWQIARQSIYGQSEWSNQVCYASPQPTSTITSVANSCSPTTDKLFIYPSLGNVTNFGGVYDSGSSGFDYTRNCKVAPITKVFLKDNFSIVESSSVRFDKYFDKAVSNCWQIARQSIYGQSEWSNQVCYASPQPTSSSGAPADLLSSTTTTLLVIQQPNSGEVAGASTVPYGATGAQCFDGFKVKNKTLGACSKHFGRDKWLFKTFKEGFDKRYVRPSSAVLGTSRSGSCVGLCYGVPSEVNGLPRNTYVDGYFRKDGTYVKPYTRSKP